VFKIVRKKVVVRSAARIKVDSSRQLEGRYARVSYPTDERFVFSILVDLSINEYFVSVL